MDVATISLPPTLELMVDLTDEQFFELCQNNRDYRFEGNFNADRAPDACWVKMESWEALIPEQRQKFIPLCPDSVVKLLSASDSLPITRMKMQEYIDNGAKLGWLINQKNQQVKIYRPGQSVGILQSSTYFIRGRCPAWIFLIT